MLYLCLKVVHIISSTLLFGTGLGTACFMYFAHRTHNPKIIAQVNKQVVIADWVFTGTSGLVQPVTGFAMVFLVGYPLSSLWLWGSIIGYCIAAFCWFPVVYFQIRLRDLAKEADEKQTPLPPLYYRYFRYWFVLGWPAFVSLLLVFYLMTFKPQ